MLCTPKCSSAALFCLPCSGSGPHRGALETGGALAGDRGYKRGEAGRGAGWRLSPGLIAVGISLTGDRRTSPGVPNYALGPASVLALNVGCRIEVQNGGRWEPSLRDGSHPLPVEGRALAPASHTLYPCQVACLRKAMTESTFPGTTL